MNDYLIERDRLKRKELLSLSREYLSSVIEELSDQSHIQVTALNHLVSASTLKMERIPGTCAYGIIVVAEHGLAVIVADPPPYASVSLMAFPMDRPSWNSLPRISIDALMGLVAEQVAEIERSMSVIEPMHADEAPRRQLDQRTQAKKLRDRLVEFNILSLTRQMELSRSAMNLIGNLEREIREEIGKATKKD